MAQSKTVSAESGSTLRTVRNLWPYMWPADRPDLIEAFATSDAMRAWVALAEKAYDAEDTFAAFARAFEDRAARLEMVDAVSADLDDRLAALLRRADADPDALPAPLRDLLMLPTPESTDV